MVSSSSSPSSPPAFSMETFLGSKLLTNPKGPPKPTSALFKDKKLVGLYFSASWCPPCKVFSPMLANFYEAVKKEGLEIVYVSSDRSVNDFDAYYGKMPWLAIAPIAGSADIKNNLAQTFGIQGIPSLVILDAKTGEYVAGSTAREDVQKAAAGGADDAELAKKAKAVVDQWKAAERQPLAQAATIMGSGGDGGHPILRFLMFFAKKPMYIFALLYFYKWMQKKMVDAGMDSSDPSAEDAVPPIPDGADSEF